MNILYKFILLDGGESSDGNAPVNTVAPEISGTIGVGEIFTSTTGTWTSDSAITYSYQWYRNGIAIVGAINNTYEIQTADIDNYISCGVNACDTDGCDEEQS